MRNIARASSAARDARRHAPAHRVLARASFLAAVAAMTACSSRHVVRMVDGKPVEHRPISVRAYGAYARGAVAEAAGAYTAALAEYTLATEADSAGVEPWTRRGAVACALERPEEAREAFDEAEARNADFEPLWTERARCAIAEKRFPEALVAAARAEKLDPDSDDAVLVHAEALEKTGDGAGALRELVGLTTRHPSPSAFKAELAVAERTGDEAARRAAARALGGVTPTASDRAPDVRMVDDALKEGDVRSAERDGRKLGLSPSDLAVRAAALGHYAVARSIADPIVLANPRDTDALVASLAARESGDEKGLEEVLAKTRGRSLAPPSPLAVLVLSEVLLRKIGPEAIEGMSFDVHATDEVARAIAVRLTAAK